MMNKIYDPIKNNKEDLGNFETHKKLTCHILLSLKPYYYILS